MRRRVLVILVILVVVLLLAWWYLEWKSQPAPPPPPVLPIEVPKVPPPARPAVAGQVVKIGAVLPLSGAGETKGAEAKKGLELALARAEAKYGLKVELLVEDDKGESSEAENLIRKLVMRENVLAVITGAVKNGPRPSHLAQELRVPILLLKDYDEALLARTGYLFGLGLAPEDEAAVLACVVNTKWGIKDAGIIVDVKDARLRSTAAAFREVYEEERGGRVVSQVSCVSGDEDFSAQINRIKARGAEVLFAATGANEGAKIILQAREAGFKAPILATSRWSQPAITGLDKEILGECYLTNYFSLEEPWPSRREVLASLQESLGEEEPSDTLALAYDAFSLLAQALSQAPRPTRETLAPALGEIKDFPGITGKLSFKGTGAVVRNILVLEIAGAVDSRLFPPYSFQKVPAPVEVELP